MSHIDLFVNTQVYYICLKSKSKIFADERDKRKFLDFVLQWQIAEQVQVFAFSILDDEIHLLIGRPRKEQNAAEEKKSIAKKCRDFCRKLRGAYGRVDVQTECFEVMDMEETMSACRCIHLLPVKKEYVKQVSDYWWSSFQAYRGTYVWKNVNIWPLIRYLDEDPDTGRRRFIKFHQNTYDWRFSEFTKVRKPK